VLQQRPRGRRTSGFRAIKREKEWTAARLAVPSKKHRKHPGSCGCCTALRIRETAIMEEKQEECQMCTLRVRAENRTI
jgi:hypothetical protein